MKVPDIYLHIGMNKTGTSAIQRFLNSNRQALSRAGLLYPSAGCQGEAHYGLSSVLGFMHGKAASPEVQLAKRQALRKALQEEIMACKPTRIVLSSENFVLPRSVEAVRDFFSPYPIRIVVYLRRHDSWWESAYAQAVKMVANPPWERGFESYLAYQTQRNPAYGNYRALLERWAKVFGKDSLLIRPYEAEQNQPDLITDFLAMIGAGEELATLNGRTERVNESMSFAVLHLVDLYQRAEIDLATRARLIQHLLTTSGNASRRTLISPALRRELVDRNAKDYEFIAREYLGRRDGRLFLEPLPDPAEIWAAPRRWNSLRIIEQTVKALEQDCA